MACFLKSITGLTHRARYELAGAIAVIFRDRGWLSGGVASLAALYSLQLRMSLGQGRQKTGILELLCRGNNGGVESSGASIASLNNLFFRRGWQ